MSLIKDNSCCSFILVNSSIVTHYHVLVSIGVYFVNFPFFAKLIEPGE